jgi:hypothetical protein
MCSPPAFFVRDRLVPLPFFVCDWVVRCLLYDRDSFVILYERDSFGIHYERDSFNFVYGNLLKHMVYFG